MSNDTKKCVKKNKHRGDIKENFCPPCLLAIPLAFAGSAVAGNEIASSMSEEEKKETPWYKTTVAIVLYVIGSGFLVYIMCVWLFKNLLSMFNKGAVCTDCR